MEKMTIGNTQIQIHLKKGIKKDAESHQQILQRISDIAYHALWKEKSQGHQDL